MRKLGFDIHGVIDTFDVFCEMIEMYLKDETVEVHVITGLETKYMEEQIGHLIDLINVFSSLLQTTSLKQGRRWNGLTACRGLMLKIGIRQNLLIVVM